MASKKENWLNKLNLYFIFIILFIMAFIVLKSLFQSTGKFNPDTNVCNLWCIKVEGLRYDTEDSIFG